MKLTATRGVSRRACPTCLILVMESDQGLDAWDSGHTILR